jgi:putative endonuclease
MWQVYILEGSDHTLYTGICKDLDKRLLEHNESPLGAKYTRSRRPLRLVYARQFSDRSTAAKEEARIKKLRRDKKLELIGEN